MLTNADNAGQTFARRLRADQADPAFRDSPIIDGE